MKRVRPDIIRVVPSDGSQRRAIQPDGSMTVIPANDHRDGLRIIDIKATGEASPAHFAELAYYGMTLAAWLGDDGMLWKSGWVPGGAGGTGSPSAGTR